MRTRLNYGNYIWDDIYYSFETIYWPTPGNIYAAHLRCTFMFAVHRPLLIGKHLRRLEKPANEWEIWVLVGKYWETVNYMSSHRNNLCKDLYSFLLFSLPSFSSNSLHQVFIFIILSTGSKAMPCPALSCPALPYPALPCLALPCPPF